MLKYKCPKGKWYIIAQNRIMDVVLIYPNKKPVPKLELTIQCDCGNQHMLSFYSEAITIDRRS